MSVLEECSKAINNSVIDLDRIIPDWFNLIDLETFEFISTVRCITGQIDRANDRSIDQSGFDSPLKWDHPDFGYSYDLMHHAWVEIINHRRALNAAR
jgi:hypothetical protein